MKKYTLNELKKFPILLIEVKANNFINPKKSPYPVLVYSPPGTRYINFFSYNNSYRKKGKVILKENARIKDYQKAIKEHNKNHLS